tara:strand:- start:256 stop:624 length:369 start_codon:yes stop_codon:yes gene_type:complete
MEKGWELSQMYDVVEHTIDYAFKGKFMLNMYEYLKSIKATKRDVEEFINSPTALEINSLILDLEDYIEGGDDSIHKQLREAYGHLGKPEARKIRNYLYDLLQDAWKYEQEKKPGRKRKRPSK